MTNIETTIGCKSRKQHKIEIWFVEHKEIPYNVITPEKGTLGSEYLHNPIISFTINDRMFTGSARIVE